MRHRKHKNSLGVKEAHRKAILNNLAKNTILHNRIVTTFKKAKAASSFVDKLVTIAKKKDVNARRRIFSYLQSRELVKKLVDEIAPRFEGRNGGYTRVIKYKNRPGDGSLLAILEFTEIPEAVIKKVKKGKSSGEKKEVDSGKSDKKEKKGIIGKIKDKLKQ